MKFNLHKSRLHTGMQRWQRHCHSHRAGISLIEVAVSLFVLAVGVMAVIALFPIGIRRVRQADHDTYSTVIALDADALVRGMRMPDDKSLTHRQFGPVAALEQIDVGNLYSNLYNNTGTIVASYHLDDNFGGGTTLGAQSLPVYVDPILHEAGFTMLSATQYLPTSPSAGSMAGYPWELSNFPGNLFRDPQSGGRSHLFDLPVATPWTLYASTNADYKARYIRHFFYTPDSLIFNDQHPATPYNPRSLDPALVDPMPTDPMANTPTDEYWQFAQQYQQAATNNNTTGARNYDYSWAYVIHNRPLQEKPIPMTLMGTYAATDPNRPGIQFDPQAGEDRYLGVEPGNFDSAKISVLIFYKRNLQKPMQTVAGCFFNGSSSVTLSWPVNAEAPRVIAGHWIMETTIAGSETFTDSAGNPQNIALRQFYVGGATLPRQAITFHRIVEVKKPELNPNSMPPMFAQSIKLESVVSNYPVFWGFDGDGDGVAEPPDSRPLPDILNSTLTPKPMFPIVETNNLHVVPDANNCIWSPVIVMDGLIEVFEVRN